MKRMTKLNENNYINLIIDGELVYITDIDTLKIAERLKMYEDIADQGYVTESDVVYKKITYMRPVKRDYSDECHPNYYKYTCPICDMLGNKHQVLQGDKNCCLCGVNLLWEDA